MYVCMHVFIYPYYKPYDLTVVGCQQIQICKKQNLNPMIRIFGPHSFLCVYHISLYYRPYDLTVVGREQIRPEHFTISSAGMCAMTNSNARQSLAYVCAEIHLYV